MQSLFSAQDVYSRLPIALQNLACSMVGLQIQRVRFGPDFQQVLRSAQERSAWSEEAIRDYRDQRLREFVLHCERTVPHYRALFRELGISARDIRTIDDLKLLPVLTKEQVQRRPDFFVSEAVSPRDRLMMHTSGTTGAGLRFARTQIAVAEQHATWWRYRYWHGITQETWCANFAGHIIVPKQQKKPPFWRCNVPGKRVMFSGYHMSPANLDAYVEELRRRKIEWLHGYPSLLTLVAAHVLERGIDLGYRIKWVSTGAENLLTQQIHIIERAFGTRPIQHYGMAEAVANISECPQGSLHVDEDFAAAEFIPNPRGSGYRVVGTNFTNYATPLLRYEMMDHVQLSDRRCSCGKSGRIVTSIDGRNEDYIVLANGVRLGRMDHMFKDMVNVREAQILQQRPGAITVRVVRTEAYSTADHEALLSEFRKRVIDGTEIKIEYVSSVPRSENGKLRFVISDCT